KAANEILYKKGQPIILAREKVDALDVNGHYVAVFVHHSMNDGFCVLRNLVDLGQITTIKSDELKIEFITETLAKLNLTQSTRICSFLSNKLLGIQLPIINDSLIPIKGKLARHFINQLLYKKMIGYHFKIRPINKSILYLKENTSEKLKYLMGCVELRFTPSPKDIRTFNLPRGLYFLYAILKPIRSLFNRVNADEAKQIAKGQK
ncbi:MAG TPA: hypothetical protein PKY86_07935, partial [Niabella sp.]|nr:hypothetical protein [Niabella sp.]